MIGLVGRGLVLSLLLSCSPGCELVAGVDRRRIPDDRELRCGDGLVFPSLGEGCDDRNLTNGDGCDTDCQVEPGFQCDRGQPSTCVTVCGDGLVRGDEECDDGNTISWDGCDPDCRLEHGFECSGEPTKCTSTCGDGLLAGFEGCDDGNGASGDGCDASCEVEPGWSCAGEPSTCVKIVAPGCGDGVIDAGEGCDDGDTISGDGCSADCAVESGHACAGEPSVCDTVCGDGILVGDEACDDGNTTSDDGCSAACVVESGYACAGQPSACSAVCGDGIVAGAEECDDANLVSLDGCSADCRIDVFSEAEPNDGTAAANGPFDHPVAIRGSNKPGTDVDVFAIALTATTDLGVETFDESGAGSCANIDTVVTVLGTDGATVLASDDDAGINACSRLDSARTAALRHLPAGTYFVRVEAYDHYRPIPGYRLEVRFDAVCGDGIEQGAEECDGSAGCTATCDRTPVCGDGFVDAPEICDDGNGASGDGCSATCQYEILGEVEPNDTAAGAPHAPPALLGGALSSASDVDTFAISLPFTADLRLETFDASGPASCAGIDTVLTLIDVDGVTTLLSRDQGGVGNCARIDPARPSDRAAAHLPAGTYHVAVTGHGAPIAGYTLLATFAARCGDGVIEGAEECDGSAGCAGTCDRIAVCGDALVDAPETCDDGNTASGDGCSAACQLELVMESEPNGTTASANGPFGAHALIQGAIAPAGDADVFAMELAAVSDVRIEVFDGSGPGSCDGVDTVATLFAEDGVTVLAKQDDGGIASCSRIDPKIDAGARHLAAGTYYVQIESFLPSTPIPAYRLEVSFPAVCGDGVVQGAEECDGTPNCTATCERVPTCGDGFVDAPETCDDGNGASGDGCSATCAVEAIGEVEPNDGAAAADAAPLAITGSAVIAGAIGAVGDVDVFRIDLASPAVATLETLDPSGDSCSIATTLRLRDAAFAELWADDNSGMASCSALVVPLTSGTHYVSVEQQGNTSIIAGYLLSVRIAGDGGAEIEPNETLAAATPLSGTDVVVSGDHAANGDVDFYAVTLPAGRSLRAEIIEGSAAETCESLDIDSALTLYDAAGVAIASDDDAGRGFCSRIDGSGALLGGTHYLAVEAAPFAQTPGDSAGQFSYRLVVRVF